MNQEFRKRAFEAGMSLTDFLLRRMKEISVQDGIWRTIFAACPNSNAVIKAALRSAKRWNCPVKFAATLNQVDTDGGYTNLNQAEFVNTIKIEAARLNLQVPVIVAVDHGGPWLKDKHRLEKLSYDETYRKVAASLKASVAAGFDLLHVDPTVDITLTDGRILDIETVAKRTLDLIEEVENFRISGNYPPIAYETGTEEVHGGLSDIATFEKFLVLLREGFTQRKLSGVWPCFVVGKVGTDLHTTQFDPETATKLTQLAGAYGCYIKGHYTDMVDTPHLYPLTGMGAANVGPEFTIAEYNGLRELENIEKQYFNQNKIARKSEIGSVLKQAVLESRRWEKWIQPGENVNDFDSVSPERQEWLISTGCRYIWQNAGVIASRNLLEENLMGCGIHASEIVLSHIECAMDKYFAAFNLKNLNQLL